MNKTVLFGHRPNDWETPRAVVMWLFLDNLRTRYNEWHARRADIYVNLTRINREHR